MRLFSKIMLSTITVLTIGLSVCGYFLISRSFNNSMEREIEKGLEEHRLLKYTLQSSIMNESRSQDISSEVLYKLSERMVSLTPDNTSMAVYTTAGGSVFSNLSEEYDFPEKNTLNHGETGYVMEKVAGETMLVISSRFEQSGVKLYLYTASNVTEVINEVEEQKSNFITIYLIILFSGIVVILLLSLLITKPIGRLTKVSRHIADGNFSERAKITAHDEIGQLGESFNIMASVVEEKISSLELEAKKREEFISDFSHELKTPLTAVIGYADMLYSKEYDRANQKKAAYYILNEGLRLEALSKKLMKLIILDKQDFIMEQISAEGLLKDVQETLEPEMQKKNVSLYIEAESCVVRVECDLMKTLLMNLVDNAVKADAKHILISGKFIPNGYTICVRDDGRGIPANELSRITEAFYMVDKSRSRKQHGAGLGLSISSKIAKLHNADLHFASEVGKGTEVCFSLSVSGEVEYE